MFINILDKTRQNLLNRLISANPVEESYLAGGTGLALLIEHRKSIDFDWFTPRQFDPENLQGELEKIGRLKVTETRKGTFHGFLDGIRVTWLYYPNPLLKPLITPGGIKGLRLASLEDIGVMKWAAIAHRGARKDFIDLYFICQYNYRLLDLMEKLPEKYPGADINYYHMVKSLSFFDDAEREVMPVMLEKKSWKEIKQFFLEEQEKLLKIL